MWWCAWTVPRTSASRWDDIIATPAARSDTQACKNFDSFVVFVTVSVCWMPNFRSQTRTRSTSDMLWIDLFYCSNVDFICFCIRCQEFKSSLLKLDAVSLWVVNLLCILSLSRWCAVLVPETDTHWSTSKTGWPKCVTTAMPSSGKEVNLSFLYIEVSHRWETVYSTLTCY